MNAIDTVIFDLDGTLLDTLDDLCAAVNHALRTHGLPERATQEIRSFLGNGIRRLMQLSVPENMNEEDFENVFRTFRTYYVAHCMDSTRPYPGIMPLLEALKERGVKMAIVSNKVHTAVQELNRRFFDRYMTTAVGESATVRRKPNPDALLRALQEMGSLRERALYVGDSEVDIETARNAGIPCVTVLWGFRDRDFLMRSGAEICIDRPSGLLDIIVPKQ